MGKNTKLQNLKRSVRNTLLLKIPKIEDHKTITTYRSAYTRRINKINYLLKGVYQQENKIAEVSPELRLEIIKFNPYNNDVGFYTAKSFDTNLIATLLEPENLTDLEKRAMFGIKQFNEIPLFFLRDNKMVAIFAVGTELEARIRLLYLLHFGEMDWFKKFDKKPNPNENGTFLEMGDLQKTIEKIKKKPKQVNQLVADFNRTSVYYELKANGNILQVYERNFLKEVIGIKPTVETQ